MRGVIGAVLGAVVAVVACAETTDPPVRDAGGPEASDEIPDASGNGGNFDPSSYPTDCEQGSDCIIVPELRQCASCCSSDTAVSREPAERDLAAAVGACHEQSACALHCGERVAVCLDQRCVLQQVDAGP